VPRSSAADPEVPVFAAEGLGIRFGGLTAFEDISCHIYDGELYGIIGPNGAGKTTLLNCVSGVLRPQQGTVRLRDRTLTRRRAHVVASMGVARTFQTLENFGDFPVVDFIMLGRLRWRSHSFIRCGFALPGATSRERAARDEALTLLNRFGLRDVAVTPIKELPYGNQRMVDVLRALASEPDLLLLDEPTSGSSQAERTVLLEMMQALRDSGTTTIVVDHDVGFISACCDRVMAMAFGRQLAEGPAAEVLEHRDVITAYVGTADSDPGAVEGPDGTTDGAAAPSGTGATEAT
jgi:ABC-type branched-subunit amino acid transport system ATPase component